MDFQNIGAEQFSLPTGGYGQILPTEGGIDSPFHAIFGKREDGESEYRCQNPGAKRREVVSRFTSLTGEKVDRLAEQSIIEMALSASWAKDLCFQIGNLWYVDRKIDGNCNKTFEGKPKLKDLYRQISVGTPDKRALKQREAFSSASSFLQYIEMIETIVSKFNFEGNNKGYMKRKLCENIQRNKQDFRHSAHSITPTNIELISYVFKININVFAHDKKEDKIFLMGSFKNEGAKQQVSVYYRNGKYSRLKVSSEQTLKAKVEDLAQKVTELNGKVAAQEGELASVRQENATLQTNVTELSGKVAEQAKDLEEVKTELRNQASDSGSEASVEDPAFAEKMGLGGEI